MANQNQSTMEDDLKTPGLGQPGKQPAEEEEIEGATETSSGLEDDDEGLEEEDDEVGDSAGDEDSEDAREI